MESDQQNKLRAFKNKVLRLKMMYEELTHKHQVLSEENKKNIHRNQLLEDELSQLKSKYESLKMAGSVAQGSSDLNELKGTIGQMMREIDECISLLND